MNNRLVPETDRDLESALSSLFSGEPTFHDAGETVVTIVVGDRSRTKGHLTKSVCQTVGRRRLSDSTMGSTGLSNISDLGSHEVWDRIGMERAYTAMRDFDFHFTLDFRDASSRDATASCQDGLMSDLRVLDFTRSEALSGWRQCRACYSWRRNSERVVLASKFVSKKVLVSFDASFHLRNFAILAANRVILTSGIDTDLETARDDVGDIFCHTWRKRGQVGRRSVMVRQVSQGVRAARRHAGASN